MIQLIPESAPAPTPPNFEEKKKDFENTPEEESAAWAVVDKAIKLWLYTQPQTHVINLALAALEYAPEQTREQWIKDGIAEILETLEELRSPPGWLEDLIGHPARSMGSAVNPAVIWPFVASGLTGYYKHLDTKSGEELYQLFRRSLEVQLEPAYFRGTIVGTFQGIGKWFLDIIEMVELLGKIGLMTNPATMPIMVLIYSDEIQQVFKTAGDAGQWIGAHQQEILDLLTDPTFLLNVEDIAEGMLHALAESAGGMVAEKLVEHIESAPYEQGKAVGQVIGYLLPEVVLAFGTEAIGTAIKWVGSGLTKVMAALRSAAVSVAETLRIIRLLEKMTDAVRGLKLFQKSSKLRQVGSKFTELLDKLLDFFRGVGKVETEIVDLQHLHGPVNDETLVLLRQNRELRQALSENKLAAKILKHCASPCWPDATPAQLRRLEEVAKGLPETEIDNLKQLATHNRDALESLIRNLEKNKKSGTLGSFVRQELRVIAERAEQMITPPMVPTPGSGFQGGGMPTHLAEAARNARIQYTDLSTQSFKRNVAVFEVDINGQRHILTDFNVPGGLHSETNIVQRLRAMSGTEDLAGVRILRVYSERQPCFYCSGDLIGALKGMMRHKVDFPVFHTVSSREGHRAATLMHRYGL